MKKLFLIPIIVALVAIVILLPHDVHAATNANLFVSAENSQYNNYFAGPQVIQVVVADPDINRLDQAYGEPIVTINGKRLRMAQATDGNWYAYFADRNQAIAASNTAAVSGKGLNFGGFCSSTSSFSPKSGVNYADGKGFTIARGGFGSLNHTSGTITSASLPICTNVVGTLTAGQMEHVVRQNKTLNTNFAGFAASDTYENVWPVIQLYDFSGFPTTVTVDYQKAGGDQIVTLTFDRIPGNLISTTLDRTAYPQNSQVFTTINDPQLNIDPTEEDSWTWGASSTNNTLYYEAFTRNGVPDSDGTLGMQNLIGNLTTFMFNHNGKLTINPTGQNVRVIDFEANGKQKLVGVQRGDPVIVKTISITSGSEPITFLEQGGVNTGVLGNWDGGKVATIITTNNPNIRGQSATLRYNDIGQSIVGGFSFGALTQNVFNNTWASGQRIPVTLTDNDADKNAKITEHLNLWDPSVTRLTTMKIGKPFSLSSGTPSSPNEVALLVGGSANFANTAPGIYNLASTSMLFNATQTSNISDDESFSFRPIFNFTNQTGGSPSQITNNGLLVIDLKTTAKNLFSTIKNPVGKGSANKFKGFDFLNYDLRSFSYLTGTSGAPITGIQIFLVHAPALTGTILNPSGNGLTNGAGALSFVSIANVTSLQGFLNLNGTQTVSGGNADNTAGPSLAKQVLANIFAIPPTDSIGIAYQFTTGGAGTLTLSTKGQPIVTDFFSVGITGDGFNNNQRINNGIYRWELEETGDHTGTFTGTNQFQMSNQLNIFDPLSYSTLRTIQHDVKFVAIQKMLQAESKAPKLDYLDLGADGVNTQLSSQVDILTHTGIISFDSKGYEIGQTVTITLMDLDLNVNNDLVDIYTAVPNAGGTLVPQDPATDTIGKTGLGVYSDGRAIGRLMDIQFGPKNVRWSDSIIPGDVHHTKACFAIDSNTGTAAGFATSLSATGFSLVETGPSTGTFTGTFVIPDQLCSNGIVSPIVAGENAQVNYVDFRDDSGNLVEKNNNATLGVSPVTIQLNPIPDGLWGSKITITGHIAGTKKPLPAGAKITFTGNGAMGIPPAFSNAAGYFTVNGTESNIVQSGLKVQAQFAGNSSFLSATSKAVFYSTQPHHTSLFLVQPTPKVPFGTPTMFTAVLKDTDLGGVPVSSKIIHFNGSGVIGVADSPTNNAGVTVGNGTAPTTINSFWFVIASFSSTDNHYFSSNFAGGVYSTVKHSTSLTMNIIPGKVLHNTGYSISGILMDTSTGLPLKSKVLQFVTNNSAVLIPSILTGSSGQYNIGLTAPNLPGTTVQVLGQYTGSSLYSQKIVLKNFIIK